MTALQASNALLALWLTFDAAAELAVASGDASGQHFLLAIAFMLLAIDVLHRRTPQAQVVTARAVALVAASVLSPFAYLLIDPGPIPVSGAVLSWFGVLLLAWSIRSLGTSFSLVPQRRRLVTGGPYRWVRHPMYLGYLIHDLGAWVIPIGGSAFAIWMLEIALFVSRARLEEHCLHGDPAYAFYAQRVRYRLIPGIL